MASQNRNQTDALDRLNDRPNPRPRIAVHKFSSCDGCQLAFINAGEALLELAQLVDIVHFAEAGPMDPDAAVDLAFVEGSISTPDEAERIRRCARAAGTS
jgi:sulfhydrogenase subunit delta